MLTRQKTSWTNSLFYLPVSILSALFFTHVFTVERNTNTYIEYDQHFFVFCASGFILTSLIAGYFQRSGSLNLTWTCLILILLLAVVAVQAIFTPLIEGRLIISLLIFLVVYIAFKTFLQDERSTQIILLIFLLAALVQLLKYAFRITLFKSLFYSDGIININSGINSNYLVSLCPFLLALAFYYKNKILAVCSALALAGCTYYIVTGNARSAWIALAISCIYLMCCKINADTLKPFFIKSGWFKVAVVILMAALALICAYSMFLYKPGSSNGRLLIYEVSLKMLSDHFAFGMGFNRFQAYYNPYQAAYFKAHHIINKELLAGDTFFAFNEYLQALIELGIAGILLSVLFAWIVFKRIALPFKGNELLYGARASLIAVGICAMFSYPLHTLSVGVNAVFFLAVFAVYLRPVYRVQVKYKTAGYSVFAILTASLLCVITFQEYRRAMSLKRWETAAWLALNNRFKEAEPLYQQSYPDLNKNGGYLFNYGSELSIAGYNIQSIGILQRAAVYSPNYNLYIYLGQSYERSGNNVAAGQSYRYATCMIPSKFLAKFLLLKLYQKENNQKAIYDIATDILHYPVKIPSMQVKQYKKYAAKLLKR